MILGVDEVGRGCWAGPLVAAAVVLKRPIKGLRDSKKLSRAQREALDVIIRKRAVGFGIGWVSHEEVDALGLTEAVRLAMTRAVAQLQCDYQRVVVDGNYNYLSALPDSRAVIKADDSVPAVSAASIIAKVARDNYMSEMEREYPGYGFHNHVGYGTLGHQTALASLGVSAIHRRSFAPIRLLLGE